LELLGYGSRVGHVGFVDNGKPMILPVNYLYENESIVVRTSSGTPIDALDGATVAFEVDDHRPLEHSGWSVLVHGTVKRVNDEPEIDKLNRGPLRSWAWSSPDRWLRISVDQVTGRRIP